MHLLEAKYFFDLSTYQHAFIFNDQQFVWNALNIIPTYLSSIKLGKIEINIPEGVFLINPHLISIGEHSIIEPGAYIQGPCLIGKYCTIRHGAYIRGNLITGNKCVIGHDTEIKNSILLDEVHAAHFAYVGDTIVGNRVNLGAGTKCANLKFNKQIINVHYENQKINTRLKKFGAIFGDDAQTGCNVVTNPGTLLGKGVKCSPVMNVNGFIPPYSLVKSTAQQVIESPLR